MIKNFSNGTKTPNKQTNKQINKQTKKTDILQINLEVIISSLVHGFS